ncbi:MAG TPA: hypothetical protein VLW06_10030 [Terriglobales bacterium]|nr:hypothetical protein [Terriglobales bacterium]
MNNAHGGFTPAELRKLRSLKTPHGIQQLLYDQPYHVADTAWSPRRVLRENTSHCFEGAIFAAAALRVNGFPPLVIDLEAEHDTDHVIAVYKDRGHWGAISKSNYSGLGFREPIFRSLRELVMSFFDAYFNMRREKTLRTFSNPVNLERFDRLHWMTTDQPIWFIAEYLLTIHHFRLLKPHMIRQLHRLGDRQFRAGCVGRAEK